MRVVLAVTLAAGCATPVRYLPPDNACIHALPNGPRHRLRWYLRDHPMTPEELTAELAREPANALDLQQAAERERTSSRLVYANVGLAIVGILAWGLLTQYDDTSYRLPTFLSAGALFGAISTLSILGASVHDEAESHTQGAIDRYNTSCPR